MLLSNEVGGDLIGNAWWSGVRVAGLLAEAGVSPDADAVRQTSEDGWSCSTPLSALTDDRDAMLAIAMNGEPLPLEHGSRCAWWCPASTGSCPRPSGWWTSR